MWNQIDVSFLPTPDIVSSLSTKVAGKPILDSGVEGGLFVGGEGWGYLPYQNPDLLDWFKSIGEKYKIESVFEIGTYAGYSATIFLEQFPHLKKIVTIDNAEISVRAGKALKEKYGDKVEAISASSRFYEPTGNFELVFIDGNHNGKKPYDDTILAGKMNPKILMYDNIELPDVQKAIKVANLNDIKYNPQYFFYVNEHKGKRQPGILGVFETENYDWGLL